MGYLDRPAADEHPAMFARYIARVPAGDLVALMRDQIGTTIAALSALPPAQGGFAYAPGKWTIREVVGHMADVERVMSYRALRFARGDATALPGFDENAWTPEGGFGERTLASLVDELASVRAASITLFDGLPATAWTRRGTSSGNPLSVRAIACIIIGHELHHGEVLATRYGVNAFRAAPA